MNRSRIDCLSIGYYEPAFEEHERILHQLRERTRRPTAGLLSYAYRLAHGLDPEDLCGWRRAA